VNLAKPTFDLLSVHGLKLVTAESCTGGMVAAAITDIAGSSHVFDCGFVTYSNASKVEQLGVAFDLITQFGAVSEEVAKAMAQGALLRSAADVSVAITGIAGPGGGSDQKPVGLVWFAVATREKLISKQQLFGDLSRAEIRQRAVEHAFQMIINQINLDP
jgi:nicotinamide-nucleotide amidase